MSPRGWDQLVGVGSMLCAQAGFCLVAEVFEGGREQRGDEAGDALRVKSAV
jgi:hypothetical protein